jgi:hypothetical protein
MLQEQQQHELPQLPAGVLQQVLSHVPLQHRLGSCSLASRAMYAAAVAATEDISLAGLNSQQKASELCQWLAQHSNQALTHLQVRAEARTWQQPQLSLALPCGLQQLQSLTLSQVELPAAPDSFVHPKLTSLCLDSCRIRTCSDVFGWAAEQLVHLTALQRLQLHCRNELDTGPPVAGIMAFEEALGQLQQLTCLRLVDFDIGAAMATISSLSQLQELQLYYNGMSEQLVQMQWLPSSLTSVNLSMCAVSCAAADSGSGSSSSSGWKLPVLEQLQLEGIVGFEPVLLKQMPQLRVFSYFPGYDREAHHDEGSDRVQQLVQVLPQRQNLQQLQLERLVEWPSPSSCASLTASTQLTALVLMECSLPAGAVQHMFAAGQQLQQLQRLEVVASEDNQAEVDHCQLGDLDFALEQNTGLLQRDSLNIGFGDLAKLASCCPRLRDLRLIWCDMPGPARGAVSEAAPLLRLTALTALQVAGQYWNNVVVERVLAKMTGEVNSSRCRIELIYCCSHVLLWSRRRHVEYTASRKVPPANAE